MIGNNLRPAACLLMLGLCASTEATSQTLGAQAGLTSAPKIDENLFMLRLLDEYYAEIPGVGASRSELVPRLDSTKQKITFARKVVQTEGLDQDLDALYADA